MSSRVILIAVTLSIPYIKLPDYIKHAFFTSLWEALNIERKECSLYTYSFVHLHSVLYLAQGQSRSGAKSGNTDTRQEYTLDRTPVHHRTPDTHVDTLGHRYRCFRLAIRATATVFWGVDTHRGLTET